MLQLRSLTPGLLLACTALLLSACAKIELPAPHQVPLSTETRMLLGKNGMTPQSPIFIRIFKAESELEVWKQREDGHFYHFKTYPICHWSGALGPKLQQGDKQSPEGFYTVNRHQMNPNSKFHLSFDLGFPNAYDKAHGRTGNFLMVHGKCKSAGCYAMTDALIEEIYALAREAFAGGQTAFHVHAFPFRMTNENLARYKKDPNTRFWSVLKKGYDHFEITRQVPNVEICAKRYNVNVEWDGRRLDPVGACPRFRAGPIVPFVPQIASISQQQPQTAPPASTLIAPSPQPVTAPRPYIPASTETRYVPSVVQQAADPAPRPLAPARDPIQDLLQR
jgi:murein L,D-transpeptidase YafK